jgi:hypothetical protein
MNSSEPIGPPWQVAMEIHTLCSTRALRARTHSQMNSQTDSTPQAYAHALAHAHARTPRHTHGDFFIGTTPRARPFDLPLSLRQYEHRGPSTALIRRFQRLVHTTSIVKLVSRRVRLIGSIFRIAISRARDLPRYLIRVSCAVHRGWHWTCNRCRISSPSSFPL